MKTKPVVSSGVKPDSLKYLPGGTIDLNEMPTSEEEEEEPSQASRGGGSGDDDSDSLTGSVKADTGACVLSE